jgi:tetratricopeptide (TPR) repeat protein
LPAVARASFAVTAVAFAWVAAARPAVDPEAMREAARPDAPDLYTSARAYAHYLRARLAIANGDLPHAVDEYGLALVYDESSPRLHVALAEALARSGRLDQSEANARRALELAGQGPAAATAHLLLGKIAAARGQREAAVGELRAAIAVQVAELAGREKGGDRDDRIDPEPWHVLGDLYLEAGDEPAAARTFEDLAGRVPGEGSGFLEMGRFYFERKDHARARTYFRKAAEADRADLDSRLRLAQTDEALDRPADARKDYEDVLRLDSENGEALLALGKLGVRAGDLPGARAYFREMLRVASDEGSSRASVALAWLDARRPGEALAVLEAGLRARADARLLFVKGLVLQEQRSFADAAAAFGQIQAADGDLYLSARANLAANLSLSGKHAEAERTLSAAMKSRPNEVRLVATLAQVRERAGRSGDAVELLRRTIAERERTGQPLEGTVELYDALASILEKAGRPKEAVAVLQKALEARPRDEGLLYALGAAYDKAGDADAAVAQMKALLTLDPDHADALNFVAYTYAEKGVKLDEAEKLVARAVQLRPENGYFLDSLGWVYFKKGDFARAIAALEKAEVLSGPEPTILEHLGDAYRSVQRPTDAAAAYRRALKAVDPDAVAGEPSHRSTLEKKIEDLSIREVRPAKR